MSKTKKSPFIVIVEILSSGCLAVMFIIVMLGILTRYVMVRPLFWTAELSRYLMIYMVFIGGALSFRNEKHPSLNFVIDKLPKKYRQVWDLVIDVFVLVVLCVFMYAGWHMISQKLVGRTPALRVSYRFIYLAIPLGGLTMTIETILRMIGRVKKILNPPVESAELQ